MHVSIAVTSPALQPKGLVLFHSVPASTFLLPTRYLSDHHCLRGRLFSEFFSHSQPLLVKHPHLSCPPAPEAAQESDFRWREGRAG